jgi:signal transduction histidine kinase
VIAGLGAAVAAGVVAAALILLFLGLWALERSRLRKLQAELETERRLHSAAVGASDEFFHVVSHELRSPIAAILGYQELLGDGVYGALEAAATEPVDRIGRSAQHLLHLIDGAVDLGRIRSGMAELHTERVELGPLLEAASEDFRRNAEERGLAAHVRVGAEAGYFRTDPERLVRAIHLLAVAAVRHPTTELGFDARRHGEALEIRIRGAQFPEVSPADDLAVRCGIRVGIADATARLLGGSLQFQALQDGAGFEARLHIPEAPPFDDGVRGA